MEGLTRVDVTCSFRTGRRRGAALVVTLVPAVQAVRQIVDTAYGVGPSGLPGNDDLGTMSAWYVFAAVGLFPQVPGRAEVLLGSPVSRG